MTLVWTRKLPEVAGWYWFDLDAKRGHPDYPPIIVCLRATERIGLLFSDRQPMTIKDWPGRWAGPIEMPSDIDRTVTDKPPDTLLGFPIKIDQTLKPMELKFGPPLIDPSWQPIEEVYKRLEHFDKLIEDVGSRHQTPSREQAKGDHDTDIFHHLYVTMWRAIKEALRRAGRIQPAAKPAPGGERKEGG